MLLKRRSAILFIAFCLLTSSGQTCREPSANSSNQATPVSANMSNQNSHKVEPKPGVAEGLWGGLHVRLVLKESGGEIEFDCAHGEMKEPLKPDEEGRFSVAGTFSREGGPTRSDQVGLPARYSGRIEGDRMMLTVTLTEANEKLDEFTLTRGNEGRLRKCK